MSFWSDFEDAAIKEAEKVWAGVIAVEKQLLPLAVASAEDIAKAAAAAVLQHAPLVLTGAEKLSAATAAVVTALAQAGKAAAINLIEAAVQAMYNLMSTIIPATKAALAAAPINVSPAPAVG